MNRLLFCFLFLSAFAIISCGDNDDNCNTIGLTYTSDIAAIFSSNCATTPACHDTGSAVDEFTSRDAIVNSSRFTKIVDAINHNSGFESMPRDAGKLSDCRIDMITAWIADGAP